jgi:copper transport protein
MGWEETLRSVAFSLVRFSAFAANALIFGLVPILLLVLRPSFAGLPQDSGWARGRRRLSERLEGLFQASLVASVTATAIALVLYAVQQAEVLTAGELGTGSFESVFDSTFGRWYLIRFPVVAVLAVLLGGRVRRFSLSGAGDERSAPPRILWVLWAALGLLLLVSSTFSGHAAVAAPRLVAIVTDAIHLAAGATWFAGIVLLAVALPDAWRAHGEAERLRLLAPVVVRFSHVALVSITIVAITGVISSFLHVAQVDDLVDSGYGRALAIKILIFFGILLLGAINHFVLRARMTSGLESGEPVSAQRLFRKTIAAELAIALAIFGTTGVLTGLARTRQTTAAPASVDLTQ